MPGIASANGPDLSAADIVQQLRERVLQAALTLLAIVMPVASITLVANRIYAGELNTRGILIAAAMGVFPLLRLASHRLRFHSTAVLLVSFLALSAFLLASRGGLTVGYAVICLLAIQLAALFFGRRGVVGGVSAVVGLHLLAWLIVQQDLGPPLPLEVWNPRSNALWIRHLFLLGLLGLLMSLGELYILEQLTQAVTRHREIAERETAQRIALEEAERAQEHERDQRALAQLAVERSHRTEALARVAGGVAHDFNNALTVILGTAEAARLDSHSPEDVETYMDEIIEAVQHASVLTGQLLTLGRQQISNPQAVPITALLARLRPALARVLPADIALVIDMPTDDAIVRLDETAFHRAMLNLVLNARDAMPRGGNITISCRCETVRGRAPQLADGDYVTLQIADDGSGMDADTLERIFDPFFTTKGEKGTGLGLASVHAFVVEAGGAIDVASAVGHGTTMEIRLPIVERDVAAAGVGAAARGARAVEPPTGAILVVEDRDDVRATMRRALTSRGFAVLQASHGAEALQVLERNHAIAVMCIDGVMPGLSTAETIERARAIAPHMRVIVCSGHVHEELLRRGIETGRYEFLAKPFTPQQLVARVTAAFGEYAATQQFKPNI